jgi:hypothetical protein
MAAPDFMVDVNLSPSEAVAAEAMGFRAVDKTPPSPMSEQLRKELVRILTDGDDKNNGAFTIAVATHVEKFVGAAREILMTEKLAQNDVAALLGMRRRRYGGDILGDDSSGMLMGAVPTTENFGVQAIRQLIEAAQSMQNTPSKLVEALADARRLGLADVAAEIETRLGIKKDAGAASPEPRFPSRPAPPASHEPKNNDEEIDEGT